MAKNINSPRWTIVRVLGALLIAYGVPAFVAPMLVSQGAFKWLEPFEWPIGYTSGVTRTPEGNYVVPHTPSDRLQIYDHNLHFLCAWPIDAAGGIFWAKALGDGTVEVYTARTHFHLTFDQSGKVLSQSQYDPHADHPREPAESISVMIPTHWWLWPLTGPAYAWACAAVGLVLVGISDRLSRRLASREQADAQVQDEDHPK